ncbi:alpha/beta fold hydrolase [Maritimibacter sp. DP1N21-5]|uniref:alpha/beta fold hydrolase n=1 Tax=Maritimibacter sp. DP1N21-5 TaxID=2836867 RepID=UPI001C439164|nr:alpha/beta hydrolase [Maritimibacter sp. DP1N21-5]MBV7409656.1 alpha/beta hydrolase [Maritimibacter sp. DP1N21-5]
MHTEGRKITTAGAQLHVQTSGDPNGRTMLFLHGGGGTLADFEPLMEDFSDFHCVHLDTRGHGKSTSGGLGQSYAQLADDVEALIRAMNLHRPALIGHSDGGVAALEVAARGHVALGGIVTIGAHRYVPNRKVRDKLCAMTPSDWRSQYSEGVSLYERLNPEPDMDGLFRQLVAMWCDETPGAYPGDRTTRIQCPALILGGEHDHLVSVDETIDLARSIPDAHLGIIPYSTHAMHDEQPERVSPFICDFMLFLEDEPMERIAG